MPNRFHSAFLATAFILVLLFFGTSIQAQFSDDFSDGDFSANPAWAGDAVNFEVDGSNLLHLNAPAVTDEAYLSTSSSAINDAVWECYLELDFNPSGSNLAQIYLVSDLPNLKSPLNGYFIRVGGTDDEISLYRQDGSSQTEIIDGIDDRVNYSPVTLRIRVTRDATGNWELLSDTLGGTNFISEGLVNDDNYVQSNFSGVFCDYTSTRSDKFFFDDFNVVGTAFVDTILPLVTSLDLISANALDVVFSEPVDLVSSETLGNYSVNNGIGNPSNAQIDAVELNKVHLQFTGAFVNGTSYNLSVSGVEDLGGNAILNAMVPFTYFIPVAPLPGEVLINELMVDPSPSAGLPVEEYLELYNNSNKIFDLLDWTYSDAGSSVTLGSYLLFPDAYVILCHEDDTALFQGFGDVLGLSSFPGLKNDEDNPSLKDPTDLLIDQVNYTDDWYQDFQKADGGFSLERINPNAPCGGAANWRASDAIDGGTPGIQNSVHNTIPDTEPPLISGLQVTNLNQLDVFFGESMDSASLANATIQTSPALTVSGQVAIAPTFNQLTITLSTPISQGVLYALTISGATDCSGNALGDTPTTFGLGEQASLYDLVINELYPDPDQEISSLPEAEFVEILNVSNKLIDLSGLFLNDGSSGTAIDDGLLFPGEYLILCPSTAEGEYSSFGEALGLSSFPSLNNAGDQMSLRYGDGTLVDKVAYSDSWYQDFDKDGGGWTLERVSPFDACGLSGNWRASESVNGGTPGEENSIANLDPNPPGPRATGISLLGSDSLALFFSKTMDSIGLINTTLEFDPQLDVLLREVGGEMDQLSVKVSSDLEKGTVYQVTIKGAADCQGTPLSGDSIFTFLIPLPGDIVINEVLFNPRGTGTDFVELYNRSQTPINLKDWSFAWFDSNDSLRRNAIVDTTYVLGPGEFVLVNEDAENVLQEYPFGWEETFLVTDLPAYSNDAGSVILHENLGNEIDRFDYTDDLHFSLLRNTDGVSLERLDYERSSTAAGNWHSAAETVGFATPGYENSQFDPAGMGTEEVSVERETFSPDNDGFEDVLLINYQFAEPGFVVNVMIYDAKGRQVRELEANTLLEKEGVLSWDGTADNGEKARIGIHIIYFEAFNLAGEVKHFKLPCVVATKF